MVLFPSVFGPAGLFSHAFLDPSKLLWTLGFLIPLILLYLIRPKPQNVAVPSLMFILKDMGRSNIHRLFRTLFRDILFLIQLLAVLLLAASLAKPFINVSQESLVRSSIIVIDDSASTRAMDRFDEIRSRARDALSKDNVIILAHVNPQVVDLNGEQRLSAGDAKGVIDDLEATDMPGDIPTALDLAIQQTGQDTKVTIISDFVLSQLENPDLIESRLKVLKSKGALVDIQTVPAGGSNLGIVDAKLNVNNGTLDLKVQNFNEKPEEFGIKHNGDDVTLPKSLLAPKSSPGSFLSISIPLGNGVNEFTLTPKDDFMTDNAYYVSIPDRSDVRALMLTNDANPQTSKLVPALQAAGDKFTTVSIEYGKPPKVPDLEHDLYIVKDIDTQFVLPGVIAGLEEKVQQGAVLVVLAQPNLFDVNWRDLLPVEPTQGDALSGRLEIEVNDSLSLTKGLSDVGQADGSLLLRVQAKDGALTYATVSTNSGREPVIAARKLGKGAVIYYGIKDQKQYDLDPQSYAILWGRIVDFSLVDPMTLNIPTGALITAPGRIATPDGKRDSPTLADLQGIYTAKYAVAANLYPLQSGFATSDSAGARLESDISAPATITSGEESAAAGGTEKEKVPNDLSVIAITAGLVILFVELLYIKLRGDL